MPITANTSRIVTIYANDQHNANKLFSIHEEDNCIQHRAYHR